MPPPVYMTEADILTVLDRVFPEWYLAPLKDPGPGYELWQASAKALERVSLAVGSADVALWIIYSHGGTLATAEVEFSRPSLVTGVFTVLAGAICRTSQTNRSYRVVADVVFGAGDLTRPGVVEAVAPGAEYNVTGPVTTLDGTILPGEIDTVAIPLLDPVYAEPAIAVRQLATATGGLAAVLDQLGLDRDLPRLPDEIDDVYRGRIRQLPDTVSPEALVHQLDGVFLPLGLTYQLIETWQNEYQSAWDAPLGDLVHPTMGTLEEDTFAYDDTRNTPAVPFRGRWMAEDDNPAGLVLVVPLLPAWAMRGMAWDDPGLVPVDFVAGLGRRATSTYDALDADSVETFVPAYDGVDNSTNDKFYLRVWELLRQVKAAGVHVDIELEGE